MLGACVLLCCYALSHYWHLQCLEVLVPPYAEGGLAIVRITKTTGNSNLAPLGYIQQKMG